MADNARNRSGNPLAALLAAATAILAVAVAVLVLWPPNGPDAATIAEAVSQRLEKDGYLKKDHFDQRMDRLNEAASLLLKTEDFERGLADLKRALASCCRATTNPTVGLQPRIWVVFENARLDEDERLTAESHGIAISGRQRERLGKLAQALLACAAPGRPVRLKIQGYSSTREFVDDEGDPLKRSEDLNLQAANLRAEVVRAHLLELNRAAGNPAELLDIVYTVWEEYKDIRRPFLDAHEEIESTDHEQLNRAVLVEVLDAGLCAVAAAGGGNAR